MTNDKDQQTVKTHDDDKLKDYREKRSFTKTSEPQGGVKKVGEMPRFVIQKHDASSLHYDFRLEIEDVLKSWAVPKGPSTDPSVKRLAINTEDHPLDYQDFEGVIPEGEYGAGTVIVWDAGTYKNLRAEKEKNAASMTESFADGKVEVWLDGEKLQGGFVLIRTGNSSSDKWLLKKIKDSEADNRNDVVKSEPKSVISGMTIEQMRKREASAAKE